MHAAGRGYDSAQICAKIFALPSNILHCLVSLTQTACDVLREINFWCLISNKNTQVFLSMQTVAKGMLWHFSAAELDLNECSGCTFAPYGRMPYQISRAISLAS